MKSNPKGTSPRLVIAYKPGQLSNRLLQFATFVAFAARTGVRIVNPSLDEYAPCFESTRRDLLCRYPPQVSCLPRGRRARRAVFLLTYYAARALARLGIAKRRLRIITLDWSERRYLDESFLAEVATLGWSSSRAGGSLSHPVGMPRCGPPGRSSWRPSSPRHFRPCELSSSGGGDSRSGPARLHRLIGVHIRQRLQTDKNMGRYHYTTDQYVEKMTRCAASGAGALGSWSARTGRQPEELPEPALRVRRRGSSCRPAGAWLCVDAIMGPSSFSTWASFYGGVRLY
jgi:hypothetical protein